MVQLSQQECTRLRDLITDYSGLGDALLADEVLERAVAQRLAAYGLDNPADYWPLLQHRLPGEINSLVQLLTNKETFFFREMHQFEMLRDRVLPELVAARKFRVRPGEWPALAGLAHQEPLRLWSAGCSTGEEAYSLAITLLEYQRRYGPVEAEIIATDIDSEALAIARQGVYGERAVRLVPDDLLRRYFTSDGRTFVIVPEVGRLVRFQMHNLADEACPADLSDLDVIFCRNVTIYFDEEARDRLNARLADALREGGYLFVASAETIGHNRGRLELFPVGSTFLFRKRSSVKDLALQVALPPLPQGPAQPAHAPQLAAPPQPRNGTAGLPALPDTALARARQAFQRQEYDVALRELDRLSIQQPVVLEAYSLRAAIFLQQERLAEAEATCQYLLAHDPWHVEAHFLMGLIFYHRGQLKTAVQTLKTVVYLQPEHRWAHFYLAEIYRVLGLQDKARREYKNTLNTLRLAQQLRQAPALNLSGLEDEVVRQACEINLGRLQGQAAEGRAGGNGA